MFKTLLGNKWFWIALTGVLLFAGMALAMNSLANKLTAERVARIEEVRINSEKMNEQLDREKKRMEEEYGKKLANYQTSITYLQGERSKLNKRIGDLQTQIVELKTRRAEIESKTYTRTELDNRFHSILERGKQQRRSVSPSGN